MVCSYLHALAFLHACVYLHALAFLHACVYFWQGFRNNSSVASTVHEIIRVFALSLSLLSCPLSIISYCIPSLFCNLFLQFSPLTIIARLFRFFFCPTAFPSPPLAAAYVFLLLSLLVTAFFFLPPCPYLHVYVYRRSRWSDGHQHRFWSHGPQGQWRGLAVGR